MYCLNRLGSVIFAGHKTQGWKEHCSKLIVEVSILDLQMDPDLGKKKKGKKAPAVRKTHGFEERLIATGSRDFKNRAKNAVSPSQTSSSVYLRCVMQKFSAGNF